MRHCLSPLTVCLVVSACGSPVATTEDATTLDGPGCPAIRHLAQHCGALLDEPLFMTLVDQGSGLPNDVSILGETSGSVCAVVHFPASNLLDNVTSMAAIGTDVFYCAATTKDGAGPLTGVALVDGKVTTSNLRCLATTAYDEKLLVLTALGTPVQAYAGFDAVMAGATPTTIMGTFANRLGSGDEKLYSTSSMPTTIYVLDPSAGGATQVMLPPSTINVMGIAAQTGSIAIIDGYASDQQLDLFDATTGTRKSQVLASTELSRLHGLTNPCRVPVLQ